MRDGSMKAEFIEAALLFRLFIGIDGLDDKDEQWGVVMGNSSTKAGDLEAHLRSNCSELLSNIEAFDDTDRWRRYLVEKVQVERANKELQKRLHNQVIKDQSRKLRLEQREERHTGTSFVSIKKYL
jgi:hypothetical protein